MISPFGPMTGPLEAELLLGLRLGVEDEGAPPAPDDEGVVGLEVVGELLGNDDAELLRRRSSICGK